jgi:HK97 gp10 family phage protein
MAVRVVLDQAAIDALASDPQVLAAVGEIADAVADRMRERAPKDTGAGAESIHAEPAPDAADGFRVSWDEDHFYMGFAELGTEHQPATPFARPTADEFNR